MNTIISTAELDRQQVEPFAQAMRAKLGRAIEDALLSAAPAPALDCCIGALLRTLGEEVCLVYVQSQLRSGLRLASYAAPGRLDVQKLGGDEPMASVLLPFEHDGPVHVVDIDPVQARGAAQALAQSGYLRLAAVPMAFRGTMVGFLVVAVGRDRELSNAELRTLHWAATLAAAIIGRELPAVSLPTPHRAGLLSADSLLAAHNMAQD
jgi:signal transduction protein with GAF and PtsI domain